MLGLFISGVLKPQSVQDVAEYLLANMAFLFVPSGVAILDEYASIQGSVVPVSYTHLDVYKRQAWYTLHPGQWRHAWD